MALLELQEQQMIDQLNESRISIGGESARITVLNNSMMSPFKPAQKSATAVKQRPSQ